jgi:hypothetical protein
LSRCIGPTTIGFGVAAAGPASSGFAICWQPPPAGFPHAAAPPVAPLRRPPAASCGGAAMPAGAHGSSERVGRGAGEQHLSARPPVTVACQCNRSRIRDLLYTFCRTYPYTQGYRPLRLDVGAAVVKVYIHPCLCTWFLMTNQRRTGRRSSRPAATIHHF